MTRALGRFFRQVADLIDPPKSESKTAPAMRRPHPEVQKADLSPERFEEYQTIADNVRRLADAIGAARRHQRFEIPH
jgi:hypothetical protein